MFFCFFDHWRFDKHLQWSKNIIEIVQLDPGKYYGSWSSWVWDALKILKYIFSVQGIIPVISRNKPRRFWNYFPFKKSMLLVFEVMVVNHWWVGGVGCITVTGFLGGTVHFCFRYKSYQSKVLFLSAMLLEISFLLFWSNLNHVALSNYNEMIWKTQSHKSHFIDLIVIIRQFRCRLES